MTVNAPPPHLQSVSRAMTVTMESSSSVEGQSEETKCFMHE